MRNKIVSAIIFIIFIIFIFVLQDSMQSSNNMKDTNRPGYVYNIDSKIIYCKIKSAYSTSYTVYYNENGNLCKYDLNTGEFKEIIKENNK